MHRAALDHNLRNAQLFLLLALMARTHSFTLTSLRVVNPANGLFSASLIWTKLRHVSTTPLFSLAGGCMYQKGCNLESTRRVAAGIPKHGTVRVLTTYLCFQSSLAQHVRSKTRIAPTHPACAGRMGGRTCQPIPGSGLLGY
ncbi:hypothetical protein BJY52DRAFT_158860 [Lactarius psammicola]|nr:hypothetical protein BJY52DRAFT_158860 [Lactarius psammicola]